MKIKWCKHCNRAAFFYAGVRGRCKECWKTEMRRQRAAKGEVYNASQRQARLDKRRLMCLSASTGDRV